MKLAALISKGDVLYRESLKKKYIYFRKSKCTPIDLKKTVQLFVLN